MKDVWIFFDYSGTLIDTLYPLSKTWTRFFGKEFPPDRVKSMLKDHSESNKVSLIIKHRINPFRILGGRKKLNKIRNEEFENSVKVFPGISDMLLELRNKKSVFLGIFTHDPELIDKENRSQLFKQFGIPIEFDIIITDEKDKGKCLKTFIVKNSISNGIVVGDTQYDLNVGKNCKFKTIGVTWGFSSRDELIGDFVVENPEELLDVILKIIE